MITGLPCNHPRLLYVPFFLYVTQTSLPLPYCALLFVLSVRPIFDTGLGVLGGSFLLPIVERK